MMFSFALVSPLQRRYAYNIPDVFLDWDPSVSFTTPISCHQFVLTTRSGRLLFRDMAGVNADVGAREGTDDQLDVFSLMS